MVGQRAVSILLLTAAEGRVQGETVGAPRSEGARLGPGFEPVRRALDGESRCLGAAQVVVAAVPVREARIRLGDGESTGWNQNTYTQKGVFK